MIRVGMIGLGKMGLSHMAILNRLLDKGGVALCDSSGLSRYVSNITLYYENAGFSTRVSQRSRSSFIGEIQGFGADRETRYIVGEDLIDFQASYAFGGDLDGLSVLLQVNNVTNEPYREFYRDAGRVDRSRSFNEYGRTYLLGATYKF